MLLRITLSILQFIVAVLGYYLLYRSDEKKLKRYRLWLFAGAIMALLIILGDFVRETKESKSKAREFASLQSDLSEIKTHLEPFIIRARSEYPGWNDQEALQKLASEISKMQPKLIFLGQTEPRRDSVSNLFLTVYVFRSEPTTGLRDVKIGIRFDGRFVTINGGKRGDIVEGGDSLIIDPDSTGFYYTARYLREGNDIEIKVISKSILKILSMSLWPDPDK